MLYNEPFKSRQIEGFDGKLYGIEGWPYLLHQLLKNNNKTVDYTFMNFGLPGGNILRPGVAKYYKTDKNGCRYEQFKQSLPHFIFFGFGGMDQCIKGYKEKDWVNSYVQLVQEAQNLPTKPMVFILTPLFGCRENLMNIGKMPDAAENWSSGECTEEQDHDMVNAVK